MLKCTRCKVEKDDALFTKDGRVLKQCEPCRVSERARFKANYEKDPQAVHAKNRRWRKKNPDAYRRIKKKQDKLYAERHPHKRRQKNARWRKRNRGKATAYVRAYQLRKARQMPKWADREAIELVYILAAQLRSEGHDVHVDHIVPLKGRDRSGLHVADNLQIVPATYNSRKHNKTKPNRIAA